MLRHKKQIADSIVRVPYGRSFKGGRTNRGFRDLRGHPDEAARVAEADRSPELRMLLKDAARASSRLFTIGCDLGSHRERQLRHSNVAGGYVQIAMKAYAVAVPHDYWREANIVIEAGRKASKGHRWRATFVLGRCQFRLGMDPETVAPSLFIYFWALSKTAEGALRPREAFIEFLRTTLFEMKDAA
jgi:hypothetical protein